MQCPRYAPLYGLPLNTKQRQCLPSVGVASRGPALRIAQSRPRAAEPGLSVVLAAHSRGLEVPRGGVAAARAHGLVPTKVFLTTGQPIPIPGAWSRAAVRSVAGRGYSLKFTPRNFTVPAR